MNRMFSVRRRLSLLVLAALILTAALARPTLAQSAVSEPLAADSLAADSLAADNDAAIEERISNERRRDLEVQPRSELLKEIRRLREQLEKLKSSVRDSDPENESPSGLDESAAKGKTGKSAQTPGSITSAPPQHGKMRAEPPKWYERNWNRGSLVFPVGIERAMYMDGFQTGPQPRMR